MKIHSYIFSLLACLVIALPGYSQVDRNETLIRSALHGLEYEIKAGFSIGGTAPLPLPVEIRSIDGYNPTLAISIGGEVTKWFAVQNKLGVIVGLRLENKAMTNSSASLSVSCPDSRKKFSITEAGEIFRRTKVSYIGRQSPFSL